MDYFLTTYAKDYKWPIVVVKKIDDVTQIEEATGVAKKKFIDMLEFDAKAKNEQEIPAAQVGAPPQGPGSKFDQPNTYLKKLYMKYPYLYEIMKITPPAELAKKVYSEKYKTTYQEDYNVKGVLELKSTVENITRGTDAEEEPQLSDVCKEHAPTAKKLGKKGGGDCGCNHDTKYHPCNCAEEAHPVTKIAWKPAPISKMIRVPRDKEQKKTADESEGKDKGVRPRPHITNHIRPNTPTQSVELVP